LKLVVDKREVAIILLVAASLFVVLLSLLPPFLTTDDSAYYANNMIDLKPGWMDGKPAYIWVGHLVFRFASFLGASRPSLVLIFGVCSALFGSLTGVNLYFVYRSIFHERYVGVASAFLGVLAPIGLGASLLIAPYAISLFFATLAVACWLQRRYLIWSLAWALAVCSHASSILLVVVWMASLISSRDKSTVRMVAKHIPVFLLVCFAFFAWVLTFYPSLDGFVRFNMYVTQKDYFGRYFEPISLQWLSSRLRSLVESNGMFLLAFSIVGTFFVRRHGTSRETTLFWWLAPYLMFYLIWPQAGGKFYIFSLAPLTLLATLGIRRSSSMLQLGEASLFRNMSPPGSRRLLRSVGVALVLVTLTGGLVQSYGALAATRAIPNEYSMTGIAINQWANQQNASANVLIISGWETHFIRFYSPGTKVVGWYGTIFPDAEAQVTELVLNTINRAHANHQRVFMTHIWYFQDTTNDERIAFAASIVLQHYRIVEVNQWLLEIL
jgi:hypothetical protein